MVVLGQIPAFASNAPGQSLLLSQGLCLESTSATADGPEIRNGFKEDGWQFIPVRPAHLEFVAWMMGRESPRIEQVFGAAMVNRNFIPVGMALVYYENDGTISVHAHFGKWLRTYPKDILRHMKQFVQELRDRGHYIAYAISDESVPGSDTLIKWFNGQPTGKRHEFGPIYEIDFRKAKI